MKRLLLALAAAAALLLPYTATVEAADIFADTPTAVQRLDGGYDVAFRTLTPAPTKEFKVLSGGLYNDLSTSTIDVSSAESGLTHTLRVPGGGERGAERFFKVVYSRTDAKSELFSLNGPIRVDGVTVDARQGSEAILWRTDRPARGNDFKVLYGPGPLDLPNFVIAGGLGSTFETSFRLPVTLPAAGPTYYKVVHYPSGSYSAAVSTDPSYEAGSEVTVNDYGVLEGGVPEHQFTMKVVDQRAQDGDTYEVAAEPADGVSGGTKRVTISARRNVAQYEQTLGDLQEGSDYLVTFTIRKTLPDGTALRIPFVPSAYAAPAGKSAVLPKVNANTAGKNRKFGAAKQTDGTRTAVKYDPKNPKSCLRPGTTGILIPGQLADSAGFDCYVGNLFHQNMPYIVLLAILYVILDGIRYMASGGGNLKEVKQRLAGILGGLALFFLIGQLLPLLTSNIPKL